MMSIEELTEELGRARDKRESIALLVPAATPKTSVCLAGLDKRIAELGAELERLQGAEHDDE